METPQDMFRDGAKTIKQAVEKYGIGRTTLYAMMNSGVIRFSQMGKRRLIPDADLCRVLAENLVGPVASEAK